MKTMKKAQTGRELIDKPMRGPGSIPKEKQVPMPPPGYSPKKPGKLPGKPIMKAKSGKSFPDLNKDGKITKADILKGRGVIAKKGMTIKKAQSGVILPEPDPNVTGGTGPMRKTKIKERSASGDYVTKKVTRTRKGATTTSTKTRRTLQGFLSHAPKVSELKNGGKMKSGGSMKKCKGGC
jgi:hypothetical protein